MPASSEWYIEPEDEMQVQELRSERLHILHWLADNRGFGKNLSHWKTQSDRLERVKTKLVELTGHRGFTL